MIYETRQSTIDLFKISSSLLLKFWTFNVGLSLIDWDRPRPLKRNIYYYTS